jgi:hypothetical protein
MTDKDYDHAVKKFWSMLTTVFAGQGEVLLRVQENFFDLLKTVRALRRERDEERSWFRRAISAQKEQTSQAWKEKAAADRRAEAAEERASQASDRELAALTKTKYWRDRAEFAEAEIVDLLTEERPKDLPVIFDTRCCPSCEEDGLTWEREGVYRCRFCDWRFREGIAEDLF